MTSTTFHAYPITLGSNARTPNRPARCIWENANAEQAIKATLKMDPEAIIMAVRCHDGFSPLVVGYLPGGLSA